MTSIGGDVYAGPVFVSGQIVFGYSTTSTYWNDVNGGDLLLSLFVVALIFIYLDGFMDVVTGSSVLYNSIGQNGERVFIRDDSSNTGFPLGASSEAPDIGDVVEEISDDLYDTFITGNMIDVLIRWVAPFTGTVAVAAEFTNTQYILPYYPFMLIAWQGNSRSRTETPRCCPNE